MTTTSQLPDFANSFMSKTQTPEEQREDFLKKVERMFTNVKVMEERLEKKGRPKLEDKAYRRLSGALVRAVAFARDKGWLPLNTILRN